MMDAREEARDLIHNPLPQIVIIDPLTRVYELDNVIAKMEIALNDRRTERQEALEYALDNAIEEDSTCKLVAKKTVSTPNRVINVEKIQKELPKVYARIWDLKRSEVVADLEKYGKTVEENTVNLKISQKVAEPALKAEGHELDEVLESGGPAVVSFSYEVIRK